VKDRRSILAKIVSETSKMNSLGKLVWEVWNGLPGHYPNVELDEFIVMPNHVHGIVWIKEQNTASKLVEPVGAGLSLPSSEAKGPAQPPREGLRPSPKRSHDHGLTEIVRSFKSFSSREVNKYLQPGNTFSRQRGYYEHVVRDEDDLYNIRSYIRNNPLKWEHDEYHQ
jgi:REP element-mobilizing transposase RayT